jgi:hypothetical protein
LCIKRAMSSHRLTRSARLLPSTIQAARSQPSRHTQSCCPQSASHQLKSQVPFTASRSYQTPPSSDSSSKPSFTLPSPQAHTAKMSTMKAQHGHSEACCNIPPVQVKYDAKGSYEEIDSRKSCKFCPEWPPPLPAGLKRRVDRGQSSNRPVQVLTSLE